VTPNPEERLPLPSPEDLDEAQLRAIERISAGPRGALIGPFVPLLRSPELMTRLQLVGEYLRFSSVLDDDLFELAILVVARRWFQQFEWGFHQPIALEKGVPAEAVDEVEQGRVPTTGRPELAMVWHFAHDLLGTGGVSDERYADVVAALGEPAVIELVATVGYYTTLALTMNVARTPPPDGAPRMRPSGPGPA
jgi:4-carboxymuconolactone decarboxylase